MKKELSHLNKMQFHVTQENGTEPPFENQYNSFFDEGIYVDLVSGEALFASTHKFPSPCGWPAFFQALEEDHIVYLDDMSTGRLRTEVRSKEADSHLGHVFTDGPAPTGIRFCINSAAIKFISKKELEDSSEYKKYLSLFEQKKKNKAEKVEVAVLGAGCFWGVEAILKKRDGVLSTEVGYTGGKTENPTYQDICTGSTGHAEVVKIEFNPNDITYKEILTLFFRLHDPTTLNSQGYDVGTQYRSVIYYQSDDQKIIANKLIEDLNKTKKYSKEIVTELSPRETFYPAEDYHQDYYTKKYDGGFGPICHYLRNEK